MSENIKDDPRKIKSVKRMKEIMTAYYIDAKTASANGKKVAWITSGGPVEPLIAMDIIPVYPENHAAMIGASKQGTDFSEKAEDAGYGNDLCSYAKSDIACAIHGGGPIGGLPKPDMLICCNNICGTVVKWYEAQARFFNVPLFIMDTPFIHTEYTTEAKNYVREQVKEYIIFLEKVTDKKMDYDKLRETGIHSYEGQKLWKAVLDTTTHSPSPMSAFDAFFHLALIVTLRGTITAVEYYKKLLAEMNERIESGIAAVPGEKIRLLWDNLPIWHKTRWLSDKFASHKACLVADTYTTAWCSVLPYVNPDDFLESITESYPRAHLNLGTDLIAEQIIEMIDKYAIQGVVMHSNRSCKPYSFGQIDIQKIIMKKRGIPSLLIESDMLDGRFFSENNVSERIDSFIEILER